MAKHSKEATEVAEPRRDASGKLTRHGMEQVIKEGGSVMLPGGKLAGKLEDLPSEADLAAGDAVREQVVAESIDAQIASLSAQRAKLGHSPQPQKPKDK